MDLRQMRYFERVARLSNFTQAAHALHLAQPALSRQIASIEREIGGLLFDRSSRRVELTPTGRRLLDHVDRVLEDVNRLDADLSYFLGHDRTQVRLGVTSALADCVLPALLPAFAATHHSLDVVIETGTSTSLYEDVSESRLDAAVANMPAFANRVREERFFDDRFMVMLPPDHAWAGRRTVALRELSTVPLILPIRGGWFEDILGPVCKRLGCPLKPRFELAGYQAITRLVREGVGLALVPLSAVDRSLPLAKLVEPELQRTLGWLEPAGATTQPAVQEFRALIGAHLTGLQDLLG